MTLTKQERDDPLWVKLRAEMEARLLQLRAANDADMSESDTAKQRGRIAEIKRFLDLGKPKPAIEVE